MALVGQEVFDPQQRALVMATVLEAIAFLEAAINEVFQDAADNYHSYVGGLSPKCVAKMADLWRRSHRGRQDVGILEKYDLALEYAGRPPLEKDQASYDDARLVIELRNYLVHFLPETFNAARPHRLEVALRNRFPVNPLIRAAGNPWLPDKALGAGCAAWAWSSAKALCDAFAERMDLRLNYQRVDLGDP